MLSVKYKNENSFTTRQDVFNFFGKSLNRRHELKSEEKSGALTLKKRCTTRWTSRIEAVLAVRDHYVDLLKILTRVSLTSDKRNERDAVSDLGGGDGFL